MDKLLYPFLFKIKHGRADVHLRLDFLSGSTNTAFSVVCACMWDICQELENE